VTMTDVTKDVLSVFDDDTVKYSEWCVAFECFVVVNDGVGIMDGTQVVTQTTATSTQQEKDLYVKNSLLFLKLLTTTTGTPKLMVQGAKTAQLPKGCFKTAWDELKKTYDAATSLDATQKLTELTTCRLITDEENPRNWFNRIMIINNDLEQMKCKRTEAELMSHILGNLPYQFYGQVIVQLKSDLSEGNLNLKQMQTRIQIFWEHSQEVKSAGDVEFSMAVMNQSLYCTYCKRKGHTEPYCWKKKKDESNNDRDYLKNITCFRCKKKGHKAANCPLKYNNPNKSSNSTNNNKNHSNNNNNDMSDDGEEQGMFVGALVNYQNEFMRENTWLLDSGANCHITNDIGQLVNKRETNKYLILPDGDKIPCEYVGDCILEMDDDVRIYLEDVYFSTTFRFNIISAGRMMENGWTMKGARNEIKMERIRTGLTIRFLPRKINESYLFFLDKMGREYNGHHISTSTNDPYKWNQDIYMSGAEGPDGMEYIKHEDGPKSVMNVNSKLVAAYNYIMMIAEQNKRKEQQDNIFHLMDDEDYDTDLKNKIFANIAKMVNNDEQEIKNDESMTGGNEVMMVNASYEVNEDENYNSEDHDDDDDSDADNGGQDVSEYTGRIDGEFCCPIKEASPENLKWLCDSGASSHVTSRVEILHSVMPTRKTFIVGNGEQAVATHKGDYRGKTIDGVDYVLKNVYFVPSFANHILSVSQFLDQGCNVTATRDSFKLSHESLDRPLVCVRLEKKGAKSNLYYLIDQLTFYPKSDKITEKEEKWKQNGQKRELVQNLENDENEPKGEEQPKCVKEEVYQSETKQRNKNKKKVDINVAHRLFGHYNEAYIRSTCNTLGWEVTGKMKVCEACALAKAKAKSVSKSTAEVAKRPGMRLFVDISGPYAKSAAGNKYWTMVVDDYSRFKWSGFIHAKDLIGKVVEPILKKLKGMKRDCKFLRCDNAGENEKYLKDLCYKYGAEPEFTAPYTPQMNGVVERAFVTVRDSGLAMMLDARLTDAIQSKLWPEAMHAATNLNNITVTQQKKKSPFELFHGKQPKNYNNLVEFGRIAYITYRTGRNKLETKAEKCLILGQAQNHPSDTYRVYKHSTKKVIITRDVKLGEWHGLKNVEDNLESIKPTETTEKDQQLTSILRKEGSQGNNKKRKVTFVDVNGYVNQGRTTMNQPTPDNPSVQNNNNVNQPTESEGSDSNHEQDETKNDDETNTNEQEEEQKTERNADEIMEDEDDVIVFEHPNDRGHLFDELSIMTPNTGYTSHNSHVIPMDEGEEETKNNYSDSDDVMTTDRTTVVNNSTRSHHSGRTIVSDSEEDTETTTATRHGDRVENVEFPIVREDIGGVMPRHLERQLEIQTDQSAMDIDMTQPRLTRSQYTRRESDNQEPTTARQRRINYFRKVEQRRRNSSQSYRNRRDRQRQQRLEEANMLLALDLFGEVEVPVEINMVTTSDPGLPRSFKEAMESPEKDKWLTGIKKELHNFKSRGCFEQVKRSSITRGKTVLKARWIFVKKVEQDGSIRYKARLVIKGYDQIAGIDYTESFSPVATDTTIRTMIAICLFKVSWVIEALDVEAAFLNSPIDEEVYVEIPEGFLDEDFDDIEKNNETRRLNVAKLLKAVYGTVQAPRCWMKTFAEALIEIGFKRSYVDSCLFIYISPESGEVEAIIVVYVDDAAIGGQPDTVDWVKSEIAKRFNITDLGDLTKHLGVWYKKCVDKYGRYMRVSMTDYVKEIVKDYKSYTGKEPREFATPGYPGKTVLKADEEEEAEMHPEYRAMVGKLMWMVKKIGVECTNVARELATQMEKPNTLHWKHVGRFVGYLSKQLEEEGMYALKLRKPKSLKIEAWCDSDYASNKDNRKSISGNIVTLGGCIVSWTSKTQRTTALSSSEAEYVALALCAAECKFVSMLVDEMTTGQELPFLVHEDNTGAIFMVQNTQVGTRTKHIDVKYHFSKDLVEEGKMKVVYVNSKSNYADLLTKNVREEDFLRLREDIRNGTMCEEEEKEE